jgi:hypothetical protein
MRKIVLLLVVLAALGVMSSVASAANGTIWPPVQINSCPVAHR